LILRISHSEQIILDNVILSCCDRDIEKVIRLSNTWIDWRSLIAQHRGVLEGVLLSNTERDWRESYCPTQGGIGGSLIVQHMEGLERVLLSNTGKDIRWSYCLTMWIKWSGSTGQHKKERRDAVRLAIPGKYIGLCN
jgi:hypothetical protein